MTNPFQSRSADLGGPATDILPVTPSDTVDLSHVALALYVERGGVISFVTERNQTRSVEVADFTILPVATRRVNAAGTTAIGIHALVLT
ncbi:spike base protein, RCAP_Rcc01079 family [Pseudotabrizicola algicola]|uniref:Uncharacterized protein n=1 Tax=Pseudotabrizicola algicola TaxID=2709381 RepID=A0A6B3RKD2_9RHOB|nr:hypothetical protein [Pseudotabrizicola algicola]NEX46527.1 hypothetical protein [Pseudotabrizicola algicola]